MAGDASFASVVLLLHCDGANASTVFTDSALAKTLTVNGNAQISTAQSKFGGASALFDGAGDWLRAPQSADFQLFGGDSTIEMWVYYASAVGNQTLLAFDSSSTNRSSFGLFGGNVYFYTEQGGANGIRITAAAPAINTWHHLALVRSSGTITLWINGVASGTYSGSVWPTGNLFCSIGSDANISGTAHYNGYIDDLRITKGVARYTTGFTPPAAAFPDGIGQVSGTVLDASSAPAARTVRGYRRDTGALVGSTVSDGGTGAYSFYVPTLDEVTVIALDDQVSGTYYNDQAIRVIPA